MDTSKSNGVDSANTVESLTQAEAIAVIKHLVKPQLTLAESIRIPPLVMIEVKGGVVQNVLSTLPSLRVRLIDYDDDPDARIDDIFRQISTDIEIE